MSPKEHLLELTLKKSEIADLNIDFVQKWIRALREPDRKQARAKLQRIDKNGDKTQCCLGVACEIYGLKTRPATTGDISYADKIKGVEVFEENGNAYTSLPPVSVRKALGIDNPGVNYLARMNDQSKSPFKIIADAYEKWMISNGVLSGPVA